MNKSCPSLTILKPRLQRLLDAHVQEWKGCQSCNLWELRTQVVFGRGSLPCDICFIGEAPGPSEDLIGQPFIGRVGKLFDTLRAEAWGRSVLTYAVTNVLGCVPKDTVEESFRKPDNAEAVACQLRLIQFLKIANPQGVVLLGEVAKKYGMPVLIDHFPRIAKNSTLCLPHPGFFNRRGGENSVEYKRAMLDLQFFRRGFRHHAYVTLRKG